MFKSQKFSNIMENKTLDNFNCSSQIGNSTSSEAYISGISTVLVRLISSFLLAGLLTKFRRRFMFMTSAFLTITFLVCFATLNYFIQNGNLEGKENQYKSMSIFLNLFFLTWNKNVLFYTKTLLSFVTDLAVLKWTSMATACLLVFSAQLGLQSLPYLLTGELFPAGLNLKNYFMANKTIKQDYYNV